MKEINVEIQGDAILMNSPKNMVAEDAIKTKAKSAVKKKSKEDQAEDKTYRMDDDMLYVPAEAIKGTMLKGASFKKTGKFALKSFIAGMVKVEPRKISLGTKDYDIDSRTVVLQGRSRLVCHRPLIRNWKLNFKLIYNEDYLPDPEGTILPCLEDAGVRVGILDFRPAKNGEFGTFKVTKFEVL